MQQLYMFTNRSQDDIVRSILYTELVRKATKIPFIDKVPYAPHAGTGIKRDLFLHSKKDALEVMHNSVTAYEHSKHKLA